MFWARNPTEPCNAPHFSFEAMDGNLQLLKVAHTVRDFTLRQHHRFSVALSEHLERITLLELR